MKKIGKGDFNMEFIANFTYSDEPISLTMLANRFSEVNINRNMVLAFLIDKQYIVDIRTPTTLGLANGISIKYGDNGAAWPIYDNRIQKLVLDNIHYILATYKDMIKDSNNNPSKRIKNETTKEKEEGNKDNSTNVRQFPPKSSFEYPNLRIHDFVILDTETTGLSRDDEVIELAIVDMSGKILYHSLFAPTVEVNPNASRVNGYTKENLKNEKKFKDEWEKIKQAIGYRTVLGHNVDFDQRLVEQTLRRYGLNPNEATRVFSNAYDSKKIAKAHLTTKSYGLESLANMVGIEEKELHNAKDDCLLTLKFLKRLEELIYYKKVQWIFDNVKV